MTGLTISVRRSSAPGMKTAQLVADVPTADGMLTLTAKGSRPTAALNQIAKKAPPFVEWLTFEGLRFSIAGVPRTDGAKRHKPKPGA